MCLAVPARLVCLKEQEKGVVEMEGLKKEISLSLVPDVKVGDFVIVHVGFALSIMDKAEAEATIHALESGL